MDLQIAKITHYYDKIQVAVIEVTDQPIRVGDHIRISGHDIEFTQEVTSLQVEHKKVDMLSPGETGGMQVVKPVKAGDVVYLATR